MTGLRTLGPALLVAILATLLGASPASATNPSSTHYAIAPALLNAGVGPMASANYGLSSSLGAPFSTATTSSTNYRIGFGLWPTGPGSGAALLLRAVSRKQHGSAGNFDLALSLLPASPTIEPRKGPGATIALTFDKPVVSATVAVTEGTASFTGLTTSGNDAILSFSNVANAQYVTIAVSNVTSFDGQAGGSGSVRLGFLKGDVNGNRNVALSDLLAVNAVLAQPLNGSTFLKDIDLSGSLSLADVLAVNANLAQSLPAP